MFFEIMTIIVICVVLFLATVVNASCAQSVKRLLNTEDLFEQVSAINDVKFERQISPSLTWAKKNGFEFEGFFLLHAQDSGIPIKCASWWSEQHKTFFLIYVAEDDAKTRIMHDFVTPFNNNGSLTSCTNIDGLLLPRPKQELAQYIKSKDLSFIKNTHFRSVKMLCKKRNLSVKKNKGDLEQYISSAIKSQAELIISLPFWKYRGAYWYFIKKYWVSLKSYSN